MILSKVVAIRCRYYNRQLPVGNCHEISHLIGFILQQEGFYVNLVYGTCNDCYHTWLEINGVQLDPSRDCANQTGDWVCLVNKEEYIVHSVDKFNINDFYNQIDLEVLVQQSKETCCFYDKK